MDSQTSALDSSLAGLQPSLCPTFQPTHTPTILPRPLSMKQPKNSKPSSSPRYQKSVLTTNVPTKMQSLFTRLKLTRRRAKGQIFCGHEPTFPCHPERSEGSTGSARASLAGVDPSLRSG